MADKFQSGRGIGVRVPPAYHHGLPKTEQSSVARQFAAEADLAHRGVQWAQGNIAPLGDGLLRLHQLSP